jgi:predicted carbohydrate-binding protein with CBM48
VTAVPEVAFRDRVAGVNGSDLEVPLRVPGRSRTSALYQPLRQVAFWFDGRRAPAAKHVSLVSSFNRWDPAAHGLKLSAHGVWSISVMLPAGEYPYLFIVDEVPWNDPEDDGRIPCEWGGDYSIRVVPPVTRWARSRGEEGMDHTTCDKRAA